MSRVKRLGFGVALICVVTHPSAVEFAASADPCSGKIAQGENRKAAEQNVTTGYAVPFAKVNLPGLRSAVDEYWRARLAADVSKLLEFEIAQSPTHLDVEADGWKKILADDRRMGLSRPTPHSIWFDETNDKHVFTYTTVLIRIDNRCVEDGIATEWVLLNGDWFTLPRASDGLATPTRMGRPNQGYVAK